MKQYEIVLTPGLVKLTKDDKWQHCILQRESIGDSSVKIGYLIRKNGTLKPITAKNVWSFQFLPENITNYWEGNAVFRGYDLTGTKLG